MSQSKEERVLYMPDSPNVGDVANGDSSTDKARADDLAAKVATGDELSSYEKVAGRGVPKN